jgi:Cupin-like domain
MADLTDHNRSIRRAFNACQESFHRGRQPSPRTAAGRVNIDQGGTGSDDVALLGKRQIPRLDLHETNAAYFLRAFVQSNRPCLIRGTAYLCFTRAATIWHSPSSAREWFRRVVTDKVPVRRAKNVGGAEDRASLDPEGRAQECETMLISMEDWISYLDRDTSSGENQLYLKDWHLQSFLEQHHPQEDSLYVIPSVFPDDMLNPFLKEFGIGDYRFVYWGPPGSSTAWHSDVMNSYSWSYNVYGEKEWTFEGWDTCIQRPGELMFVPAKQRHSVSNCTEALSINHNWISVWNLNDVWQCMKSEIKAIDKELESWNIHDVDAKENMLRGCLGLDVTSFIFMILWYGIRCTSTNELDHVRLQLLQIMDDDQTFRIGIRERLAANLIDSEMAGATLTMARKLTE